MNTETDLNESWYKKLKQGLSRTSRQLNDNINKIFTHKKVSAEALEDLSDILIMADMGVNTAEKIVKEFSNQRYEQDISNLELRKHLSTQITEILTPVAQEFDLKKISTHKPYSIVLTGVNGSGKTTTIGKLARYFRDQDLTVMMVAGDTFRAAAIEQLRVWGLKTGCPVIRKEQGADSASLIFDALKQAQNENYDIVLIDTAGRLQNQSHLMAELEKIERVMKKVIPEAPHEVIQILDASAGQNAISQVELFSKSVTTSGLIITKLDGSAKGGIVVGLADRFALPIYMIGVGEQTEDMKPFSPQKFSDNLLGIE